MQLLAGKRRPMMTKLIFFFLYSGIRWGFYPSAVPSCAARGAHHPACTRGDSLRIMMMIMIFKLNMKLSRVTLSVTGGGSGGGQGASDSLTGVEHLNLDSPLGVLLDCD